ncbi:MAG: type 1 glutamine amidotransferase domain-containing protein [Thermodesulfobacteriota bacterium]
MGDTGKPTGLWLEEVAAPYYAFKDAGINVEIASIKGGTVPIDPRSLKEIGNNPPSVDRFLQDKQAMSLIKNTKRIDNIDTAKHSVIFLPGGHGTMWDLPESKVLAGIVTQTLQDGRIVSAVCHGPAGLVSAKDINGNPVVKGLKVTAFTNSEEEAVGLTDDVPFLLETRLRELGAEVIIGPDFEPHAVADGNLITGQNPASSGKVAELIIQQLQNK